MDIDDALQQYVIARKRKKYKFAKFAFSDNCYEYDDWSPRPVDMIEIGAGTGIFSLSLAKKYPKKNFLALDVKADRLQKGAYLAIDENLHNISFLRARADQVASCAAPHTVSDLWLTFPDPFPKERSSGRRLTHPTFLRHYEKVLTPTGILHIKHDNSPFFEWTLEQLVNENWQINQLSFDTSQIESTADVRTITTYERRWLDEGRVTKYVAARPPKRARSK